MADNAMTHERRLYWADPRGIGLSRGACMVCGGVADDLRHDCAFFVPSRETGEAIVALFQHGAKLDYRPSEPRWCQVKVTACGTHRHNLESLVAAVSGTRDRLDGPGISAEMVADFVTPAAPPAAIQGEGGVPESLATPETLEMEMWAIFAPYFRNGERRGLVRVLDVSPHYGNEAEREKIRAEICRRWNRWSAQAAEIARLTILASRSELSAVAKALAWEGPYQCSLAGRVKSLVHSNETRKDSLDLLDLVIGALAEELGVEQDNEAMHEAIQALRDERDVAYALVTALREALEIIAKGETVVFDADDLGENVITLMDEEEMREIASAALSTEAAPPAAEKTARSQLDALRNALLNPPPYACAAVTREFADEATRHESAGSWIVGHRAFAEAVLAALEASAQTEGEGASNFIVIPRDPTAQGGEGGERG